MRAEPVRLGMVRLADAAPVVHAVAAGLFEAAGVPVRLAVEPSWANIADKLAWGLLDGAVMLPPLAIAMTLGLRDPPTRLLIPAGISRNGNAITLAARLADTVLRDGPAPPAVMAARVRDLLPLRLAVVHGQSTHDLLLRLFLESGGVDAAELAPFAVIPPAEMPRALAEGRIDGFCAGAPWGAVAAERGVGRTVAVSSAIAPGHPEKCLAVRADWAAGDPEGLEKVCAILGQAAAACNDPAANAGLASLLAEPEWVGVPADLIARSLPGGDGDQVDRSTFGTETRPSDAEWLVRQIGRWRTLPSEAVEIVKAMYIRPF